MIKKIIRNSFANFLGLVVSLAVTFFIVPFLIHKLGMVTYGIWSLVISVIAYTSVLDIGIGFPLIHYVASYKSKGDKKAINRFCSTSFILFLILGVIGFLSIVFFALFLLQNFRFPVESLGVARTALFIGAVGVLISFPLGVYTSILGAYQRYVVLNLIIGFTAVIKAILVVVFFRLGRMNLISLSLIEVGTVLLAFLMKIFAVRRIDPDIKISLCFFDIHIVPRILIYGFSLFIMSLAVQMIWYTDGFVIGYFLSISSVAVYAIGHKLNEVYKNLFARMIYVIYPSFAELESNKHLQTAGKLLVYATKYITAISAPAALLLIVASQDIIKVWIGKNYSAGASVLSVLAIASLISLMGSPSGTFIQATNNQKKVLWISISHALGNLFLSVILVQKIGIVGVAWGTAIPYFLCNFFLTMPFVCRCLAISYRNFLSKSILPSLLPAGLALVCGLILRNLFTIDNYPRLILYSFIVFSVFLTTFFKISMSKDERVVFSQQVIYPILKAIRL